MGEPFTAFPRAPLSVDKNTGYTLDADGREVHANGFISVASPGAKQQQARAMRDELLRRYNHHDDLVKALAWFIADEQFSVGVGGNPIVVADMIVQARAILASANPEPTAPAQQKEAPNV